MTTSREDSLFGRIALDLGLVSEGHLKEALIEQARSPTARLLGAVLVELGHLSEEGLKAILLSQRQKIGKFRSKAIIKQDDASFGAIAVREGFITQRDLDDALTEQFKLGKRSLILRVGEILVKEGKISADQVKAILRIQQNRFVTCRGCGSRFRILEGKEGLVVPCSKCGESIELKASSG